MTIAELHGKISRTGKNLHDQMEDLLTSNMFSVCKYVRPETLLIPFLKTAITIGGDKLSKHLPSEIQTVEYKFWPRLPKSEPDVLISIQDKNNNYTLIMIEVKYLSSKSGFAYDEEELELAETPKDQLAREYLDLFEAHHKFKLKDSDIAGRHLVYLTANRTLPSQSLKESFLEISHFLPNINPPNLYWATWFNLHSMLSQNMKSCLDWETEILLDLTLLLERKGLKWFGGFKIPLSVKKLVIGSIYSSDSPQKQKKLSFDLTSPLPLTSPIFYDSKPIHHKYKLNIQKPAIINPSYERKLK